MRRFLIAFMVITALLVGMTGVSNANPGTGVAVAVFQCQTVLPTFPTTAPKAAPNCTGSAIGGGVGVLGKTTPSVTVSDDANAVCTVEAILEAACKGGGSNVLVYGITYNEPCPAAVPAPPPVGFANGAAAISSGPLVSGTATVYANFSYVRVGAVFASLLTQVQGKNGGIVKGTVPAGTGAGVAAGIFKVKVLNETIGDCSAPATNQTVNIAGAVAAVFTP